MQVELYERELESRSPVRIEPLSQKLASQVLEQIEVTGMGYCPALPYFQEQQLIDEDLLAAVDNLAWLGGQYLQNLMSVKLAPLFSTFKIIRMQCMAFMLPAIKPKQRDVAQQLAVFLSPARFSVVLEVGVIQKHDIHEVIGRFVGKQISNHLRAHVKRLDIKHTNVVG